MKTILLKRLRKEARKILCIKYYAAEDCYRLCFRNRYGFTEVPEKYDCSGLRSADREGLKLLMRLCDTERRFIMRLLIVREKKLRQRKQLQKRQRSRQKTKIIY